MLLLRITAPLKEIALRLLPFRILLLALGHGLQPNAKMLERIGIPLQLNGDPGQPIANPLQQFGVWLEKIGEGVKKVCVPE